ncbi:MAG: right-handed parallel beta-helix repeat-containing protein [Anaerolineales bacterium]
MKGQHRMRKVWSNVALIFVVALVTMTLASPARAATLEVDGACVDSNGDGLCDDGVTYKTIQAAVDAADPGDVIQVGPAVYHERVVIPKELTLQGDPGTAEMVGPGPDAPTLDGEGASGYGFEIADGVDDVIIEGFIIQNYGPHPEPSGGQSAGVAATNGTSDPTTDITIRYNRFDDINWAGIFFYNSGQSAYERVTVTYNEIQMGAWSLNANVYGIECTNCAQAYIAHNEISGGCDGIALAAQGTAAHTVEVTGNRIENNTIQGADEGNILLLSYDPTAGDAAPVLRNTRIVGNHLLNDGATGEQSNSALLVYPAYSGRVEALTVMDNVMAVDNADNVPVDLATTKNITFSGNTITVTNPAVNGRALYLNSVGGSFMDIEDNLISVRGSAGAGVYIFHGLDLRGSAGTRLLSRWLGARRIRSSFQHAELMWAALELDEATSRAPTARPGFEGARILNNRFYGENVGNSSAALRLRASLPSTATVSIAGNEIRGFNSGMWVNAPQNLFIRNNTLIQNGYGINTTGTTADLIFQATGNVISGSTTAGMLFDSAGAVQAVVGGALANANVFRHNGPAPGHNVDVTIPATSTVDIDLTYNDWGLTDVCEIGATLHDPVGRVGDAIYYYDLLAASWPNEVPADGVTPATITGTLTGLYAPAGNLISYTTDLGVLDPTVETVDAAGDAASHITSTVEGLAHISVTVGMACEHLGKQAMTSVRFGPAVPVAAGIYLPLVVRNYVNAPDLVVTDLVATANAVTVTIQNQGGGPVEAGFWVDVYIDPDTAPQAVNEIWPYVGDYGLVWGITSDWLPMLAGETMTLTVGDEHYFPTRSNVAWPLAVDTPLYAQVDSANPATTYGAVLEIHEILGRPYNNILGPVSSVAGARSASPAIDLGERPADEGSLPPRP